MTNLADLFDMSLFAQCLTDGYVRVQTHPTLPLSIANYAEKTQYENYWNPVTKTCRGLIYDADGTVLARPYSKFFNYGDAERTGPLDLTAPVVVTDKLDGSLGISYPTPDGPAIATRGSFASDQAVHATALLRSKYPDWRPVDGYTYLWEIVYPENRIVVDYGQQDDLILHGVMSIASGELSAPLSLEWPDGPTADQFSYETLAEALAAEPRVNAEGLVVRYSDTGLMVKLKQADYVALHKIITGLNARTVWEWLGEGKSLADLCATVPDEFHPWITGVTAELEGGSGDLIERATVEHAQILANLPDGFERRDYAQVAGKSELRGYLFLLLDGNDSKARDLAWREMKPSGARSLVAHSEAVA